MMAVTKFYTFELLCGQGHRGTVSDARHVTYQSGPIAPAEDEALLQGDGLTPHSRLAVALRLQLKRARDAAGLTP